MRLHADTRFDAVVVGAGFGGLGAALALAESGARVVVLEALTYPGGCASSFTRGGSSYEAGATLFSALAPDMLFGRLLHTYAPDVDVELLDPVIHMRSASFTLDIPRERPRFIDALAHLPDAPSRDVIARALSPLHRAADVLWPLFDDDTLLPPLSISALAAHAARAHHYLPLVPLIDTTLARVLAKSGVADFRALRLVVDAMAQITVQTDASHASALFGAAALDYPFRGTGHVKGGIGVLARAVVRAIEKRGGHVIFGRRARAVAKDGADYVVTARDDIYRAPRVVLNLVPGAARAILDERLRAPLLSPLDDEVKHGFGACMLYRVVARDAPLAAHGHHVELIDDESAPLVEGNHVFVSMSARDEARGRDGHRTLTASTHVALERLLALPDDARALFVHDVHARMRATIARRMPELAGHVVDEMTASPRTFARFSGRTDGAVGGIPRFPGVRALVSARPLEIERNVFLVGDSVFPGQSVLATFIGGRRVAAALARRS